MRRLLPAMAAFLAVLVPAAPAWAHAQLVSADPARDATLTTAPAAVRLEFSERLNPDFTTIVVSDAAQHRVPAAPPAISGARGTITFSSPPANGTYLVAYRVVSVDGHTVQGSYPFTVADPARPAASEAAAPSLPPADSGGVPVVLLVVIGALLAAAAAYLLVSARRAAGRRR